MCLKKWYIEKENGEEQLNIVTGFFMIPGMEFIRIYQESLF